MCNFEHKIHKIIKKSLSKHSLLQLQKKEESKIPPPIVRSAIPEISDEPMKMQEIEMMEKKEEKIEKPVEMKNENMEMEKEKEKEKIADIEKPQ